MNILALVLTLLTPRAIAARPYVCGDKLDKLKDQATMSATVNDYRTKLFKAYADAAVDGQRHDPRAQILDCILEKSITAVKRGENSLFVHDNKAANDSISSKAHTAGDFASYVSMVDRLDEKLRSGKMSEAQTEKVKKQLDELGQSRFGLCFQYAQLVCYTALTDAIPAIKGYWKGFGVDASQYVSAYRINVRPKPEYQKNFTATVAMKILGVGADNLTHNVVAIRVHAKGDERPFDPGDNEWIVIDSWVKDFNIQTIGEFNSNGRYEFTKNTEPCGDYLKGFIKS